MSDPYTTITSQPKETLAACARILELRGKESEQVRLREDILQGVSGRVMEIGCGTGPVSRHLSSLPGVQSVIGLDPSEYLLDLAREMGGENIEYRVGAATDIPAQDGSFDYIVLWTTLVHIPKVDHVKVFAEVARCLGTGGRVVVFDNDRAGVSMATHQYDIFKVIMDHFPHAYGADSYIMRNLPAALQKSGFVNVEPLKMYTVVDTDKQSYGFSVGMRAVDIYGEAGIISPAMTQALKNELKLKAKMGTFQIVLSYASVTASKKD